MSALPWSYATIEAVAGWESWQRDYRFGAFHLFPPDELRFAIDELRRKYDPRSAAICTAHISLSDPAPRPASTDDISELTDSLTVVEPFQLMFNRPHATAPHPGVVYSVGPETAIAALRDLIHASSLFAKVEGYRRNVPAHMTIAEFVTLDESLAIEPTLNGHAIEGAWRCLEVVHASPDGDFNFHPAIRFHLGRP